MASLQDLIDNLKLIEEELPSVIIDATATMANDAKALAERIIKSEGFGKQYSQRKTIPAFYLYDKAVNVRGLAFIDEAEHSDELVNWADFRRAQGLQTNFVDLSYTSRMWMGMRPGEVQVRDGRYFCEMGHNDAEGQRKMNWNFERYGDFLGEALRGQEDVLINPILDKIEDLFYKHLG